MNYPGIHHVATTPITFSLENSLDDLTTGPVCHGGPTPATNTYFKDIIFRSKPGGPLIGSLVGLLQSYTEFEHCAFIGDSNEEYWIGECFKNTAAQTMPGERILIVTDSKMGGVENAVKIFSNVEVAGCWMQAKKAFYCASDALYAGGKTNTIDLATGAPGTRTFLELADSLPLSGSTAPENKTTTETVEGFWAHVKILDQPTGEPITSLVDAFEHFVDWRRTKSALAPAGITRNNEYKEEYYPFPEDVYVTLDTGEPPTAVKNWTDYE